MSTENFMIDTKWLRNCMRIFVGKSGGADLSTNALLSDLAKNSEQILTLRVNELFEGKNKHFAESHAECLVEQAIEHVKVAREKVESTKLAKCAVEAELERQIQQAACRMAAAERRATAAEERANKAEISVRRLEDELQRQTMRARPRLVRTAA
jgi:hypothetical protein